MEYLTAELLELAGNLCKNNLKDNITPSDLKVTLQKDEELGSLLRDYKPSVVSLQQHKALQQWKEKTQELLQIVNQLPPEEISWSIKWIDEQLRVVDATHSCREVLQAFTEEVESEESANEIRRLSTLVIIKDNSCMHENFADQIRTRTKTSSFTMTLANNEKVRFDYSNLMCNVKTGEPWIEMKMSGALNGVLWTNNSGQEYVLNRELLSSFRASIATTLQDKESVRFLVSIGEAESGGGIGNVEAEMENMIFCGVFGEPQENILDPIDSQ